MERHRCRPLGEHCDPRGNVLDLFYDSKTDEVSKACMFDYDDTKISESLKHRNTESQIGSAP